jgi:hypothetical protein
MHGRQAHTNVPDGQDIVGQGRERDKIASVIAQRDLLELCGLASRACIVVSTETKDWAFQYMEMTQ